MTLTSDGDGVFLLEIRGTLAKADFDRSQARLADEMRRRAPVRLLFVLDGFDGWEPHVDWNDLTFYVRNGDLIDRIAIVGEEKWRAEALMFAGADLRLASVEFFCEAPGARDHARQWLTA